MIICNYLLEIVKSSHKINIDIKGDINMDKKKVLRPAIIGFVVLLISLLITGFVGISDLINSGTGTINGHEIKYGFANSLTNFWLIWRPSMFKHETAYIGQVLFLLAIALTLIIIILACVKKKPIFILPALFLGMSIAYLPFILILVVPMVQLGVLRSSAMGLLSVVTGLVLISIMFEVVACQEMLKDGVSLFNKVASGKPKEEEKPAEEEKKEEPAPVVEGLSEEQVREIVEQYLKEHVDELHRVAIVVNEQPAEEEKEEEPQEEPQPEPAPEEPEEEPEEAEEEEEDEGEEEAPVDNAPVGLNIRGKRRRASFETRLKNSEFDLRHKYYDLRDYIKWYGLRNRISIPGDTFSYKRQRYVFVTIVGKHIRVYLNLDPNDYADSTIPVEPATAKKYEDLPCLLRVKSDLSYRRAKKLVDDLMQKIGMDKPDEDEPKETQKDE